MKQKKKNLIFQQFTKYMVVTLISLNLTSCFLFDYGDDPVIIGSNTYKGILIDLNGNPVSDKTIILRSSFNQPIAEFITDENGLFEGQGDIYDTGIIVGLENDGNILIDFDDETLPANNYFTIYSFDYTSYPSGETVEFPPLIYAPISNMRVEIINNTGLDYSAEYQFTIGVCEKDFYDNSEVSSLCFEEEIRTLNFSSDGTGRVGVFAVTGSTITVTLSNGSNTVTESFLIEETNQVETMTFN